ncbi:glycine betaine ABC transporter substrate-binding protein [Verminephrobacter eiseniae]|uniref:Substrate-binding region of ABC-type glycine betaine transport system n=1 Tax=Verminephrobacter eiseniae (strain EF01-2) TaxID=391735 RepID=A1WQ49_VEREI|nr:glycine betaine ABC transporter substrate-binding protein [Verminephrobacter eiseniae]ABM59756.1 Substrate-binding region of ABC-type glycine betaine transport system [Verminephrobacter eiseniae EF01-2]
MTMKSNLVARQRRQFLTKTLGGLSALSTLAALSGRSARAQAKPLIKIGFVDGWADSVATTHLAAAIIRTRLGHPVETVPLAAGIMWQGVARGDLDTTLSAWLPVTHEAYLANFKDKVQIVGVNYSGARIGLIVPDYVKIDSLAQLNDARADFDNRIVGIDSGAGIMRKTEEAIKAYGLALRLQPSSGPAMTAELDRAYRANKPIAVTGWMPHWVFAKYKLRFLADPKGIYGGEEHTSNVIHPGLHGKAPAVVALLKKLSWNSEEIGSVMLAIDGGAKPEAAVDKWIADNPARVASWLDPAN